MNNNYKLKINIDKIYFYFKWISIHYLLFDLNIYNLF